MVWFKAINSRTVSLLVCCLFYCSNVSAKIDRETVTKYLREGQIQDVITLINQEPDKSYIIDSQGTSLLHLIASRPLASSASVIDALLANGLGINVRNGLGISPLMKSIRHGRLDTANYLLSKGADVNHVSDNGNTPLLLACGNRVSFKEGVISLLIEKGARVDQKNARGESCLIQAVRHGNIALFDELAANNADIELTNKQGRSALHIGAEKGAVAFIEKLISIGASREIKDRSGNTPLLLAISFDKKQAIYTLVKSGASVNAVNNRGISVAETVVRSRDAELLRFLRENGLDINDKRIVYRELIDSIRANNYEVASYYIQLGVNPNLSNKQGEYLVNLLSQASKVDVRLLKLLVNAGAELNHRDKYLRAALVSFIENDNVEAAKVLVKAGADLSVQGNIFTPLTAAISKKNYAITNYFIQAGADVRQRDRAKEQPLNYAVTYYDQSDEARNLINTLIDRGASLDIRHYFDKRAIKKIKKLDLDPELKLKLLGAVGGGTRETKSNKRKHTLSAKQSAPVTSISVSESAEIHVVGVYEGETEEQVHRSNRNRQRNTIKVNAPRSGNPIVLVLSAYSPVHWDVQLRKGSNVERVILSGYHAQVVSGLNPGTPLFDIQRSKQRSIRLPYAYKKDSRNYHMLNTKLKELTGKDIKQFYGNYRGNEYTLNTTDGKGKSAGIYKWVDEKGRTHFGDSLPGK